METEMQEESTKIRMVFYNAQTIRINIVQCYMRAICILSSSSTALLNEQKAFSLIWAGGWFINQTT